MSGVSRKTIEECSITVVGGQIMTRLVVKDGSMDEVVERRKVVVPKCIHADGTIDASELAEEALKAKPDPKRLTSVGDIVMKLSTPYDAAIVTEESEGAIVPSFCAIIRDNKELHPEYLLAFLNSNVCKSQLKQQAAGTTINMLSVGKLGKVIVPIPGEEKQAEIGRSFVETQRKLHIMEQIVRLEQKKNDIQFKELVKAYE